MNRLACGADAWSAAEEEGKSLGCHGRADPRAAGGKADLVVDMGWPRRLPGDQTRPDHQRQPAHPQRIQSPTDRARYEDTTKCILCACCTTSCLVFWARGQLLGPAAIVNVRTASSFDCADEAAAERLDINESTGRGCRTTFNH